MWGLEDGRHPWYLSLGLVLTSFGWWEAYLPYRNAIIAPRLFAYLRQVINYKMFPLHSFPTRSGTRLSTRTGSTM